MLSVNSHEYAKVGLCFYTPGIMLYNGPKYDGLYDAILKYACIYYYIFSDSDFPAKQLNKDDTKQLNKVFN